MSEADCAPRTLIKAGILWDGRSDHASRPGYVAVDGGRIVAAAEGPSPAAYSGWPVIDLSAFAVLPGAIDAHVHLFMGAEADPVASLADDLALATLRASARARDMLSHGITTARDCGGREHADIALRTAIDCGIASGPRLLVSGKLITMTGGQGHRFGREADGIDDCRRAAREQLKAGADFIKLMATGGVTTAGVQPGVLQLELEELAAAVAEARKVGKLAAAHAQSPAGIKQSILAGVRSIEHGVDLPDEIIELMLERGAYLVPTLSAPYWIIEAARAGRPIPAAMVAKTERIYEVHRASVGRAAAAGVKMAMGTDAGTPYNRHGDNLGEIELLVDAGLTAADAWRTATAGAAALLGLGDEIGTIEAGKRADLIAIAGDPFADVRGLPQRIKWVMQAGNVRRDARSGGRK